MNALVVDDSRSMRMILRNILVEMGMEVLEASNGIEGLARLKQHPDIELMLVDWNMPVMDGLEMIQAVRADQMNQCIRILMVTSEAEGSQVSRALTAGANEYLMKPFTREVLIAKLNMLDVYQE